MLSRCCSDIANKYGMKVGGVKKLVPNLRIKVSMWFITKMNKIHRLLKFKQSNWSKEYIDFNTEKRKNAVNNFENNFLSC